MTPNIDIHAVQKSRGGRHRLALRLLTVAGLLLGGMLPAGCGKPAGVIFEPVNPPLLWPAPPAQARISYIGQLSTSADLKPAQSGFEVLGQALFGKKDISAVLSPFAVCTDGHQRLFVADTGAQLVHVFDLETRKYSQWKPPAPLQFTQPVALAWDPGGRLLVSDSIGGAIFVFNADGSFVGKIGEQILQRPAGLAIEPGSGRIFVADVYAHQVVILAPDGTLVERFGQRGSGMGEFNFPTNIVFDGQGRLYVSDSLNFRVQEFTTQPRLRFARFIGKQGDAPGTFAQPKGLAVDSDGHVYVVDSRFESVQIFNHLGQLLLAFGEEGTRPGTFWLPAGIYIDPQNRIWVADTYNRRIQVFQYLAAPGNGESSPTTAPTTRPIPEIPDSDWDPSRGGPVPWTGEPTTRPSGSTPATETRSKEATP